MSWFIDYDAFPPARFERITWEVLKNHPATQQLHKDCLHLAIVLTLLSQVWMVAFWSPWYFFVFLWVQLLIIHYSAYYGYSWIVCTTWRKRTQRRGY